MGALLLRTFCGFEQCSSETLTAPATRRLKSPGIQSNMCFVLSFVWLQAALGKCYGVLHRNQIAFGAASAFVSLWVQP